MQTFENGIICAEIAIKSYHVEVSHNFNQLLILSQNLTSSQMRVPVIRPNYRGISFSFNRTESYHIGAMGANRSLYDDQV